MVSKIGAAGFEKSLFSFTDANGFPTGIDAALVGDTTVEFYELVGGIDFNFQEAESPVVTTRGNNKGLFTFEFSPTEKSSGELITGVMDLKLASRAMNHDEIATPFNHILINPADRSSRSGWLINFSHAQSADTANFGAERWVIESYRVTLTPKMRAGAQFQGEATWRWAVTAKPFSRWPWGQPLVPATHISDSADGDLGIHDSFFQIAVWEADGVEDDFDLITPLKTPDAADILAVWRVSADLATSTQLTLGTAIPAADEYYYSGSGLNIVLNSTPPAAGTTFFVLYNTN